MDLQEFLNFLVSMLAVLNPASGLAVFLGMTGDKSISEKQQIAIVTTLSFSTILIIIAWLGILVLKMFGISLYAFEITGGIILLMRGLTMLHSKETPASHAAAALEQNQSRESIAVVPLAVPMIAGPGAMTTVIIYSQHFPDLKDKFVISVGILLVALVMGTALYFANSISRVVGATGIKIITRIMGLILAAIAMSMITTGIKEMFPGLS